MKNDRTPIRNFVEQVAVDIVDATDLLLRQVDSLVTQLPRFRTILVWLLLSLLLCSCVSTWAELEDADTTRFHQQQKYWILVNCDKEPERCQLDWRESWMGSFTKE